MSERYFPRLDGVRALAVIGVLATHFLYDDLKDAQLGRIGVRTFFVLSGFLITRILLDYRARMSVGEAARTFYWRRFLRLAPPYYLAIALCLVLGIAQMRADWPWHALYASNVLFDLRNLPHEPAGHLWSLAVEEQFYLVWFVVVVCLPRTWLLPAIAGAIVAAPIFRVATFLLLDRHVTQTPAVMDCLAMGTLLGWASLNRPEILRAFGNWPVFFVLTGSMVTVMIYSPELIFLGTIIAFFGASLVALAALPETRGLDWLQWNPLSDLGRISYGVYLYHLFVLILVDRYTPIANPYLRAAFLTHITLCVSIVSWKLVEKPALRRKSFLEHNHRIVDENIDRSVTTLQGDGAKQQA